MQYFSRKSKRCFKGPPERSPNFRTPSIPPQNLELKYLWLQHTLRQGRLVLVRQPGKENFADLFTKHLKEEDLKAHLTRGGYELREGRPGGATELAAGAAKRRVAAVLMGEAVVPFDH